MFYLESLSFQTAVVARWLKLASGNRPNSLGTVPHSTSVPEAGRTHSVLYLVPHSTPVPEAGPTN